MKQFKRYVYHNTKRVLFAKDYLGFPYGTHDFRCIFDLLWQERGLFSIFLGDRRWNLHERKKLLAKKNLLLQ